MKTEGQRIYGRATDRDKRSARVNRQSKGRAARFFTFAPFVFGSVGSVVSAASLAESFFALTHELTESGDPAGFLASPAGFIARVCPDTNTWHSDEPLMSGEPQSLTSP